MGKSKQALLSELPSVNRILENSEIKLLIEKYSHDLVVGIVQNRIDQIRDDILSGSLPPNSERSELILTLVSNAKRHISDLMQPSLKKVVNGTGVVLHTGLGRAPLMKEARENLMRVAEGYASLELDLGTGNRGNRAKHVEELLCQLTGAEAACVVNNNAAAVLLVLNTMAFGKEVIISRGQLIEIGGSFRIPDVMSKSGVVMREVGTTNRTHTKDYEAAISKNTALLCVVHTSNFRVKGFTKEVPLSELVDIGNRRGIPIYQDLGGGVLVDLRKYGLPYEPVVGESINSGAHVVSFSGDKVLGGPQCGIIAGKHQHIAQIKANPLMRALRCDKLTYAALEPTLRAYFHEDQLIERNQVLRMFLEPLKNLQSRGVRLLEALNPCVRSGCFVQIEDTQIQAGSGALPLERLPSKAMSLQPKIMTTEALATKLRASAPPIIGYIREDKLFIDLKTTQKEEDDILIEALNRILDDSS